MFDDIAIRAIFIGASILVILFIFSLVIIYYNQAKDITSSTSFMPIETFYVSEIENGLKEYKNDNKLLTGNQLKNMINYYKDSSGVEIFVNEVKLLNGEVLKVKDGKNINGYKYAEVGFDDKLFKVINYMIDPTCEFTLKTSEKNDVITYTFELSN